MLILKRGRAGSRIGVGLGWIKVSDEAALVPKESGALGL